MVNKMALSHLKFNNDFKEHHQSWISTALLEEEAIRAMLCISLKNVRTERLERD